MRSRKFLALVITFALTLQLFPAQAWAEVMDAGDGDQTTEEQVLEFAVEEETEPQEEVAPQDEVSQEEDSAPEQDAPSQEDGVTDTQQDDATQPEDAAAVPDAATEGDGAADTNEEDIVLQSQDIVDEDDINGDPEEETILTPYAETWYYTSGHRESSPLLDKSSGRTYVVDVTD